MSFMSEYNALRKKRQEEEEKQKTKSSGSSSVKSSGSSSAKSGGSSFMDEYYSAKAAREKEEEQGRSSFQKWKEEQEQKKREEIKHNPMIPTYLSGDPFAEGYKSPYLLGQRGAIASAIEEDLAPVDERTWFQKGEFEDGYQFGDITKTILGTRTDVAENLGAGILGMGEKVVDALAYLAPAFNAGMQAQNNPYYSFDIQQYRQEQEWSKEFIQKDLYDEEKVAKAIISAPVQKMTGIDTEKASVLGERSDALVQSAGQLAAQYGLSAVGVPWFVTSGLTSFGSETETALQQGATYEQAGASGAISAGAEILSEQLFGGDVFTKKAGADLATKYLSTAISNKVLRNMAKFGIDVAGEGIEEVLSQVASRVGSSLYKEEDLGEILFSEEALDEYLESAIGGIVLGGGMSAVNATNSKGKDYATGLTHNEQAVVDKVYNDLLSQQEGKVTAKQKADLYDSVLQMMDRGEISTDIIESVLAKDSYDAYDALQKEYDEFSTLYDTESGKLSGKQQDRLNELKAKNAEKPYGQALTAARQSLSDSVLGMVNGDRLLESYNERGRRGQAFDADLSQYDTKYHATIQKAVDSGILNNTRRTHEFVDLIAKVSADKGVLFDFTDNAKLKESGFASDGKTVNGYVTKDGVTLNINSSKALNAVVGHEITHVLEGTEFYDTLQQTLFDYAKAKGEYNGRYAELTELYKNIEGANIEAELTADLVGDYLFTDSDFINRLSTEHRNVFQKIYDEIKYLCKVATAGSKEARELERVRKAFQDAYRAGGKAEGGTKYSLTEYSEHQKKNWATSKRIVIYDNPQQLSQFIQDSIANKTMDKKMYFGAIPSDLAARIRADAGVDVENYNLSLGSYEIRKILKDHGNEETEAPRGQRAIVEDDFAHIVDIVLNPQNVALSDQTYMGKSAIVFEGEHNGRMNVVAVVSDKRLDLFVQTVFANVKKGNLSTPTGEQAPINTPEANNGTVSDVNVARENSDVKFSISEPVEETKDLIALHNLHTSELLKQLQMGGMPYPSIAITKPEMISHDDFGEISLILQKDAIDPKKSKYNKVYSADAYTPTFPQVDYEASEQVAARISNTIRNLYGNIPDFYQRSVRSMTDYTNIDDELNRWRGEQGLIEKYANDHGMMQVYLAERGEAVPVEIKRTETSMTDYQKSLYQSVVDKFGVDVLNSFNEKGNFEKLGLARRAWLDTHGEALKDMYAEEWSGDGTMTKEEALEIANDQPKTYWRDEIYRALEYIKTGGVTVKETEDIAATNAKIDEKIANSDYEQWLSNLFSGIEGRSGLRNSKDTFTPSGNRRSFAQLHDPVTVENIVKVMRKENQTGQGALGGGNIQGASVKEFGSIAEIKKNSGTLGKMDQSEHDAITKRIQERFWDITRRYAAGKDIIDAQAAIAEAVSKNESKAGIARYLKQYDYVFNYTDAIGDDIISLRDYIRSLPTPYFEAKPQRAVSFDEIGVFVIPNNADVKLKQELLNRGYAIAEYDPNIEGHRQQVVNQFEEYKFSLSDAGNPQKTYGDYNVYGEDVALAPVQETVAEIATDDIAPVETTHPDADLESLEAQMGEMDARMQTEGWDASYEDIAKQWSDLDSRIAVSDRERLDSIEDTDAPPMPPEAPPVSKSAVEYANNPLADLDWYELGDKKKHTFMHDHPEFKPFFIEEAKVLAGEFGQHQPGMRWIDPDGNWHGAKRFASESIETLLDDWHIPKAKIEQALNEIIDNDGESKLAAAKRIEIMLNDRLLHGYTAFGTKRRVPPNKEYIDFLVDRERQAKYGESFEQFVEEADRYAPPEEDIAPVIEKPVQAASAEQIAPVVRVKPERTAPKSAEPVNPNVAKVLTEEQQTSKDKASPWTWAKEHVLDNGMVFEDLSLATGNRELQAKWNSIRYAEGKAQQLIGEGNASVSSLKSIRDAVEETGKTQKFYEYLYHLHNVDRMSLEGKAAARMDELYKKFGHLRIDQVKAIAAKEITDKTTARTAATIYEAKEYLNAGETKNKPVFGDTVTAEDSRKAAAALEKANPEFKQFAQEVYDFNTYLRELLVDGGVISSETAKLWEEMYPHYVPIRRAGDTGLNINVPLDTGKTGVNAPVKRATGGSRDILPLFDTMAQRAIQTYKAIARNRFGVELKHALGTTIANEATDIDEVIDSVDTQDGLLQEGKDGKKPTFTVFEDGKKVTFEITEEMYDAMKPSNMRYTSKVLNTISNIRRGTLTEYNPWFLLKNAVKDVQDILINSQHPGRTYLSIPKAISQMATNGHYYQEYLDNGGEQNTYFDNQTAAFEEDNKVLAAVKKFSGLDAISKANNVIERLPRLAEYIASREAGRSVDVAMLDAARVTTNFAAGGDLTKLLNRNGATFLNASVQGAVQQARNIREAKMNGLKGWAGLAARYLAAGLSALALNHLLWDDDEEYEELSDYVKQNYYIVGKFGDGKFVRIPKGRTVAVIQNAFQQMENLITGNDEADLGTFLEMVVSNLAPNNPIENNILAPIIQVKNNQTWYGEDLVPTRLQNLPAAEQYDESTDAISKWLGETFDISPVKVNYLLDQYSGVIGDTFLPMLTPAAESGDDSFIGNLIAPLKDMFTTDSVMKNQNVSDFYTKVDELTVNANASGATDEDILKSKYMSSVNADLGKLYGQKREIQNSDLPDDEKYEQVRDIQQQIVDLAREGLDTFESVVIDGEYANVGDRYFQRDKNGEWQKLSDEQVTKYLATSEAGDAPYASDGENHYRLYEKEGEEPTWKKLTDEQLEKQEEVTKGLGITPEEYWGNKEEYDFAYENPEKYVVAKSVGGYESYRTYSSEMYDIKADKDANGDSIRGSRKEKIYDYVSSLDCDYGMKLILFKNEYNADDTYNYEIIDYLNSRNDISYEEMETILKELGFDVDSEGNISW